MNSREQIFSKLVNDNHASIYRICLAYLYDKSYADDLYQEILLQVWISLDSYAGAAKVSTWVYRVAVNTAITYNATHKKASAAVLPEVLNMTDECVDISDKEGQLNALYKAISMLEERDRLVVSLMLEDLSYKEIADITGSNINNIGVRINRIKTRIMKLMESQNSVR